MTKQRLDKLIVERGLADSRARAQSMIMAGQVLVANQLVDKPGHPVDTSSEIRIKGEAPRYVSRGGLKLEAALLAFDINVEERLCIDIGASTGGFTDCMLQHGARRVWAIDVGHNQLAWKIRQDPRVVVREGVNARNLNSSEFPELFDMATIDVSFISLAKILPAIRGTLVDRADCIALVKPQFEVGKGEVGRGGIVTDPAKHRRVLTETTETARSAGFVAIGLIESPILGAEGNREFLLHLKPASDELQISAANLDERIAALTPSPG
jgi:23S rRNA (cytidine1920-2'-O)/16S rRNA (cytidine1409-2'-O)-methyltransferase